MRKAVSLLFVFVMLFSITACNSKSKDIQVETKYVGEWKANVVSSFFDGVKTFQTSTIILSEDGTATYEDKTFKWRYSKDTNQIILSSDETNQKNSFEIETIEGKEVIKFFDDTYYRADEFIEKDKEYVEQGQTAKDSSAVIVSLDNWQEYFEVVERPVWNENAFGETAEITVFWGINLKEEYHNRIDIEKSSIVSFEISAKYNTYGVQVDYNNKNYSYLDCLTAFEAETETTTVKFDSSMQFNSDKTNIEYMKVFNSSVWDGEYSNGQATKAIYKYFDITIPRIEGTIYLYES